MSAIFADLRLCFGLAYGALLAQLRAAADFAWFLVMFSFTQLAGQAAALEQFLEAAQSRANRFAVMDTHPERHTFSLRITYDAARSEQAFIGKWGHQG
jgi:hypothetical protein